MLNIDKKYLIGALIIVLIVAVVCFVRCMLKEKFTDLKGAKKSVMLSDDNGNIELYSVDDVLKLIDDALKTRISSLETKHETLNKQVQKIQSTVTNNYNLLKTIFPKGDEYISLPYKDGRSEVNGAHLAALTGNRDIWIYNPKFNNDRKYLQAVEDRVEARFYPNKEPSGTLNPRFRILTY